MEWALWILAVVILGIAAVASSGRLGELPPAVGDRPEPYFPPGPLDADALRSVRFAVVPRGYSMEQVDALLRRLATELESAAEPIVGGRPNTENGAPLDDDWSPGAGSQPHPAGDVA